MTPEQKKKANAKYQRKYKRKNLRDVRKAIVGKGAELKREVFEHYNMVHSGQEYCDSDYIHCVCCDETEYKFLCLDHINNDGNEDRKKNPSHATGRSLYARLRNAGYPEGYQILCYNCNMGKHINGGKCPHND